MKRFLMPALLLLVFLLSGAAFLNYNKYFEITKNIEIFSNLYKEINAHYVDETDPSRLMKTGIDAMLKSLDPFTNYISEAQIENYRLVLEGRYNGIGARAKKIGDYATITEIYEDYPAHKAGLRIGDQVIQVNGLDAKGKDSEDLYQIMRGTPKSEVEVKIIRPGVTAAMTFKIIRDEVNIPNVPYSTLLPDSIGYINLITFTDNAGKNVQDALTKLKNEHPGMRGVILDLRENGGGLLHEAVNVCNTFVPQGQLIASTRGKLKETNQVYHTRMDPIDDKIPLAVLINGHSASASEIVSGAMQDLDRGVVIGQISYGKGLVQNTKDVGYNAKVKLTISKYYIPSGRCIQSVRYDEEGNKIDLPDSLRSAFKTKNGRTVYDGGGVQPDISMEDANYPPIVQKLVDDNWIFNYVTEYTIKNQAPTDPVGFEFKQVDDFISYLRKNQFDDLSTLELKINELDSLALLNQDIQITKEMKSIRQALDQDQWKQIEKHKAKIGLVIGEHIVERSFFDKGLLKNRLVHDPLVEKATKILLNTREYSAILHK
ncbi:MAG: S41 family peptidase [Saprospiraceae bacterium]|nr:S41 family peptidase [Saprospiraceae bacterium]